MLEIDEFTPKEGYFVGLIFKEGYWFVRLARRQQRTKFAPYTFNSGVVIATGGTSDWETPTDSAGREQLEPQKEHIIYQIFIGLSPSAAKLYLAYPERVDRMSIITPRGIPGDIGYWDGQDTPYRDPNPETELWVVKDLIPQFNVENPQITGESMTINASFYITPYTYKVVTDMAIAKKFVEGEKRATIRMMGDPNMPISAPAWLLKKYEAHMLKVEEE